LTGRCPNRAANHNSLAGTDLALHFSDQRRDDKVVLASPLKSSAGRLVEYFIHPSLRGESDRLYRARVLVALLIGLNILLIPPFIANQLADVPSTDHIINAALTFAIMLGNGILLLKLRRHGSYAFCSASATVLIAITCVVSLGVSGGPLRSSVALLLSMPVLMAYFFGGVRWGNRAAVLSTAIVLAFVVAERAGVALPNSANSPRALTVLRFIVAFVCVSAVSAMAFIYEFTATLLKRDRDRNHRKATVLAQTDVLTGLFNRRSFEAHLQQRIAAHACFEPPPPFILCYLDLDDFKAINDHHGHAVGDEVLQNVAERLHAAVRGSDIVGRHGGDEFMVLLDATHGASDAHLMAERTLESIRRPIHTQAGPIQVGASLGFAVYPRDATSTQALKKAADNAMYAAKRDGGNGWKITLDGIDGVHAVVPRPADDREESDSADGSVDAAPPPTPWRGPRLFGAGYAGLVEWFIPASLRLDSDTLHRTRILVMGLILMTTVVAASATMVTFAPLPTSSKIANLLISCPIVLVIAYVLWQLRRNGNYRLCSNTTVLALLTGNLVGICVSGGLSHSPASALLAVPPLLAFFFGGVRRGAAIAAAAITAILILFTAELAGLHIYNSSDLSHAPFNQLLVNSMGLIVLWGMAFIYEFTTAALMRERDLEHEKVNRLAYTDSLTGLANRLDFDAELTVRIARFNARITRSSFALCMLDLDGFKPINDEFGHDIGDVVLQTVSERLLGSLRESDYVGRQGGDEFMLIFDAVSTTTQVEVFAKRLALVLEPPIETAAGSMRVTGSLGFALFPSSAADAEALKRAADRAMYTAKRSRSGWSVETR
jgi:diguanylate cyclase (GGDEF)-like protein